MTITTTNPNEFIWCEKHRPKTVGECILPEKLKNTFLRMVEGGELPNMLFSGTSGLGKTTVARALCDQLGLDHILINASEDGNIDTLRGRIRQFASSVSLSGGFKVVILDESDHLNPQSTQPALRGFMEEFSSNSRFILTCNFKSKIIDALHSRCAVYDFNTTKSELVRLYTDFMQRMQDILDSENVDYNPKVLAETIKKHAPDWRRVINEVQRHSISGSLNNEVMLDDEGRGGYSELFRHLKSKDFKKMRRWVVDNMDKDPSTVFRGIYDSMTNGGIASHSIPQLVLILADYQHKHAFVADHELNLVACLTECMANVDFT